MVKKLKIISQSTKETKDLATNLVKLLAFKTNNKRATIIGLEGGLGGGKTTFVQGLAKGLSVKGKILSPTFIIMRNFSIKDKGSFKRFYHFDAYRICAPKEINNLGFQEIISNPDNIVVIEWANIIKKLMPQNSLWVNFQFKNSHSRIITISLPPTSIFRDVYGRLKVIK